MLNLFLRSGTVILFLSCSGLSQVKKEMIFNAMAPLHIMLYHDPNVIEEKDWELFRNQLAESKDMGLNAISVDVWWGMVELEDNIFLWDYYFQIFNEIINHDLDIIPILSFHSFDPGSSSKFRAPVPSWVWPLLSKKSGISINDLKYNSEEKDKNGQHKFSDEYISHWANEWAMPQYSEFIEEFVKTFQKYLEHFQEINISLGPTGELRYPSYNGHDGGAYPNRGRMQCYSKPAESDFHKWVEKTQDKNSLTHFHFLEPQNLNNIIENEGYLSNSEILNLFSWYNYSLMRHGNRMLRAAAKIIPDHIPIGFKIPGIHWKIKDPKMPRIAEITCGLINGSTINGQKSYLNSLRIVLEGLPVDRFVLHFTCIEQKNSTPETDIYNGYSRPEDLVREIEKAAKTLGLKIKGENSLSKNLKEKSAWSRIEKALVQGSYAGITLMRVGDITADKPVANNNCKKLIKNLRN